jgi:predicted molibdopterin-dependent oxidoreductase YjgC
MRIENHPILNKILKGKRVFFELNGKQMEGFEGEPIAIALRANGVMIHRYTTKHHQPRGMFCAIGRCTDCAMIVDGKPNVRTCITALQAGMKVETQYGRAGKEISEQYEEV